MAVKVLLATTVRWPSAARLAGAFAAAGCAVDALLPADHPARRSRYFSDVFGYRPFADLSSLRHAVARAQPDLIIALDDRATALLLRAHASGTAELRTLIEHSLGAIEHYTLLMSRSGFIEAARQADIRTPATRAIENLSDLDAALAEIGYPAVLKADGTWGGDGVATVRNAEEAHAAFQRLCDPPSLLRGFVRAVRRSDGHHLRAALEARKPAISLQAFVAGSAATTSFACWQGKLLACNHLETLAAQETHGPASVLRRIEDPDMDKAAARLAARFGLSGLHGLDCVRDEAGKAHLIEINPRSPQSSYLSFGAGHDLVSSLVSRLDGRARAPRPRAAGDVVALFPQEWMRDPTSSYLTQAFHDVPWDDPALIRAWMESGLARPALEKWRAFIAATADARRLAAEA
jgi:hypothetical protein